MLMAVLLPVIVTDLLLSFAPWILFLGEIYLAKHVYGATRRRLLLHRKMTQLRLLTSSLGQRQQKVDCSDSTGDGRPQTPRENQALLLMLREQLPTLPSTAWERLARAVVVASVLVLTFSGVSVLLRPFANRAVLIVMPLCLPLATIPLPYLLGMKPRGTLLFLMAVLGLSFLALVVIGV